MLRLRPYQVEAITAVHRLASPSLHLADALRPQCLSALSNGFSRIGISAPTGSGKTAIFTALIDRLPALIHRRSNPSSSFRPLLATKCLIIVPSLEIAFQTRTTISKLLPLRTVHLEQGPRRTDGTADVVVATYQTLARNDCERLYAQFDPLDYKAVIVDEAHHSAAQSYRKILHYFDRRLGLAFAGGESNDEPRIADVAIILPPDHATDDPTPPPPPDPPIPPVDAREDGAVPIFGFTATFDRADRLSLGSIYEIIAYNARWIDMIGSWLSPIRFTTVAIDSLQLDDVKITSTGDFSPSSLATAMSAKSIVGPVVQAWKELASERKSTLVFAVDLNHMRILEAAFLASNIDAQSVSSKTPTPLRNQILDDFKNGKFSVLVNVGVLTEGADIPSIDCVLLARPTRSMNLLLQMIGRGLRRSVGKEDCLIIDLVGASKHGAVSTPTLLGLDPNRILQEESATDLLEEIKSNPPPPPVETSILDHLRLREIRYTELSADDLATARSTVSSMSPLAWIDVGDDIFILGGRDRTYARIEPIFDTSPNDKTNKSTLMLSLGSPSTPSRFHRPVPIETSNSNLQQLFRTTDAFINRHAAFQDLDSQRNAPWRSRPATKAQVEFITRKIALPLPTVKYSPFDDEVDNDDEDERARVIAGEWVGREGVVEIRSLTAGEAGICITRQIHGFGGRLKKAKREFERAKKAAIKLKKFSTIR